MTDPKSARDAADWVDREYGRLDILVNHAGIAIAGGPPSQTDVDAMREVYETNVFGVIIVTNAMLPLLRRAPAARIVNVSSEVGSITSMTDPASPLARMPASLAYPSSKSAKELRETPIMVNAANPGYTATDLNRHSGFRSVAEGAEVGVHLATLDADGPSGILWGHLWTVAGSADAYGPLPWKAPAAPRRGAAGADSRHSSPGRIRPNDMDAAFMLFQRHERGIHVVCAQRRDGERRARESQKCARSAGTSEVKAGPNCSLARFTKRPRA